MAKQGSFLEQDPASRRADDFYPTPAWQTLALLRRLPWLGSQPLTVMEPCVGNGAILSELPHTLLVRTNDVVVRQPQLPDFLLDARLASSWRAFAGPGPIDVSLTNPPFDMAFDIVRHAYEVVTLGVIKLLRLSWLEPTGERGPWLKEHPPTRVIVMPRHDYRGNGQVDSVTSAWMLWGKTPAFTAPGIEVVTREEKDELVGQVRRRGL